MGDARTIEELRRRIADYRRLRGLTPDKQFIKAIDRIIAETEAELRRQGDALAAD